MNNAAKLGIAVGVVGAIVAVIVLLPKGDGKKKDGDAGLVVELRPKPGDPDSIVDPMNGNALFKPNCTPCHGWRGQGDGPADGFLWRRPRNLSDGSYMNVRTDKDLMTVVNNGGRSGVIELSRLMPAWNNTFNTYQQADIVSWVRRLHPRIEDFVAAGDFTRYESVLSAERAAQVKAKSGTELADGDHALAFFAVWSGKTGRGRREDAAAPQPGASGLSGYVAFTTVDLESGDRIQLVLAISPEKKVHKAAVFEKVVLLDKGQRDEAAVDAFVKAFEGAGDDIGGRNPAAIAGRDALSKELAGAVKRLYWRLLLAIEQDKEDWEKIAAGEKPNASHPGRAIYDRMQCEKCHGPTGRAKGPGVSSKEPLPANLANGAYMNALPDDYILKVLKHGGSAMNISSTMPEYAGQMTDAEMKSLVEYIRTLAVPAGKP